MKSSVQNLTDFLDRGKTAYHAAEEAAIFLEKQDYVRLAEGERWALSRGGKYYVMRNGSSLIAFAIGEKPGGFRIVASHLDSPALKIKGNPVTCVGGAAKLNTAPYGGALYYSWLDIPLSVAGRVVRRIGNTLRTETVTDSKILVIPSLAIHMQREANKSLALNPQIDLSPILSLSENAIVPLGSGEGTLLDADLFLVNASKPYFAGLEEELLVSPRIDDLASAFASLEALNVCGNAGVSLSYLADNEEIGSRTKQGAGSDFLKSVLSRIAVSLGEEETAMLANSFFVSADNAHAIHPNHPEKSDPTNPVTLGGGVVIKYHAGGNYTTDAISAAIFKSILDDSSVPHQDFYMRSDMPCGSTLGAISSLSVSIPSVDIGIAQLAMHSATETMACEDYLHLRAAMRAFYRTEIAVEADGSIRLSF